MFMTLSPETIFDRCVFWRSDNIFTESCYLIDSVTRWLDYWFNIWPFRAMKICLISKMLAKISSKFRQNTF